MEVLRILVAVAALLTGIGIIPFSRWVKKKYREADDAENSSEKSLEEPGEQLEWTRDGEVPFPKDLEGRLAYREPDWG